MHANGDWECIINSSFLVSLNAHILLLNFTEAVDGTEATTEETNPWNGTSFRCPSRYNKYKSSQAAVVPAWGSAI